MRPMTAAVLSRALAALGLLALPMLAEASVAPFPAAWGWWAWPLLLFVACIAMGIVAVPAGIGGGTLFVPIVAGFFPFHLDYVRGAGLLVALASAVAAGPHLLRRGLADLRLALAGALVAATGSFLGALVGLALSEAAMQVALGICILGIALLMSRQVNAEFPPATAASAWSRKLGLHGVFEDIGADRVVHWQAHRLGWGALVLFGGGLMGGMFGVGAGWANVPAFNLIMGVPLRIAAGTSGIVLSAASSSAAWVYLNHGAVLAMIAVPAVAGSMIGGQIGARLLHTMSARTLKRLVVALLALAGMRAILKGIGFWI